MNITMLIDTIRYGGGAERQFVGLAKALYKKGYNIHVIAYHNHDGYKEELESVGVPVEILKKPSTRYQLLMSIKSAINACNPDIVITYKGGPNNMACILKALGARWKLIVSDRNTRQSISPFIRFQYGVLYKFADSIVPNSYSQKGFIETNFSRLKNKIHVITNFTDTNKFHPSIKEKTKCNVTNILVVARIAKQKNVMTFIEAAKILATKWKDKIKIIWYGRPNISEEEYAEQCIRKITKYGLQEFFEFHKPEFEIEKIYRKFDIFCLPSLYEGFPNTLCEAMASGLPVAASRICDNERIVFDGVNGRLFSPESPEEIASSLEELLFLNDQKRKAIGEIARESIIKNMSIEAFINKYIDVINSCMKNN